MPPFCKPSSEVLERAGRDATTQEKLKSRQIVSLHKPSPSLGTRRVKTGQQVKMQRNERRKKKHKQPTATGKQGVGASDSGTQSIRERTASPCPLSLPMLLSPSHPMSKRSESQSLVDIDGFYLHVFGLYVLQLHLNDCDLRITWRGCRSSADARSFVVAWAT